MRRSLVGTFSFFEQWAAEVLRQPSLMFTLILAPFLLLFAFGDGVELGGPRPRTVVVQPPESAETVQPLLQDLEEHVLLVGTTESLPLARRSLVRGEIDAVAIIPEDPQSYLERGEQVPLRVLTGEIDPVRRSYARAYMRDQVAALNQRTIEQVVAAAQGGQGDLGELTQQARSYVDLLAGARQEVDEARAQIDQLQSTLQPLVDTVNRLDEATGQAALLIPGLTRSAEQTEQLRASVMALQENVNQLDARLSAEGGGSGSLPTETEIQELRTSLDEIDGFSAELLGLSPDLISAPFQLQMEDVTPVEPSFTSFYSPGVLVLLVQHLAVTLGALTLSRMRLLRVTDILQVAPIRSGEVVIGNYLSYAVLTALAAAGLLALIVLVLGVPVFGSWLVVVGTLALIVIASLGIGFITSLLSSSAYQAAQVAMLILLGSIFFSGFAFNLDRIEWPARGLAYLFPATYGIRTLQDVMLRGVLRYPEDLVVLGVAAVLLFVGTVWLMRRELRPR